MEHTNESAKVQQTKHLLAAQLIELLEDKPLRKISVNDICQKALISRSAFYSHFEDKYQLLRYCMEERTDQWQIAAKDRTAQDVILYILDDILKKRKLFYHIFMDEIDREQAAVLQKCMVRIFEDKLKELEQSGEKLPGPLPIVSAFLAGGIVHATVQWIQNDFDISKEEMADCSYQLISAILR